MKAYKCKICGFMYKKQELAKKCYDWCKKHKSCNSDIVKHSINLS